MATPDQPWLDRTPGTHEPDTGDGGAAGEMFRTRRERRAAEAVARLEQAAAPVPRPSATPRDAPSLNGWVGRNGHNGSGPADDTAVHDALPGMNGQAMNGQALNGRQSALPPQPRELFARSSGGGFPGPSGSSPWRATPAVPSVHTPMSPAEPSPADATAPIRLDASPAAPRVPGSSRSPGLPDAGRRQPPEVAVDPHEDWAATPQRPGMQPPRRGGAGDGPGEPDGPRLGSPMPGGGAGSARPSLGRRVLRDAREVLGTVAIALGIAIVIKTFLIQPFYIPSQSMESTLAVGDRVLVSKLEPGPFELNRGDVAVFVDPGGWLTETRPEPSILTRSLTFVGLLPADSGEHLIKRVIGLPGDTVKCCDVEGRVLVNNQPIDESQYLFPGDSPSTLEFEVLVPDGSVWVMGDHRSVSEDSRYHDVDGDYAAGAVPIDNVVGRAVLVMWPWSRFDWLGTPEGVFDGVGGQFDGVR